MKTKTKRATPIVVIMAAAIAVVVAGVSFYVLTAAVPVYAQTTVVDDSGNPPANAPAYGEHTIAPGTITEGTGCTSGFFGGSNPGTNEINQGSSSSAGQCVN